MSSDVVRSAHHVFVGFSCIPLNAELNPTCHLLALLGGATKVVVSRLRVKLKITIYESESTTRLSSVKSISKAL